MSARIVATREELRMRQRRGAVVFAAGIAAGLAAAAAVFASSGLGAGGISFSPAYFFGPHMVRAEVIVKIGGATHDFRLDRGTVRAVTPTSITLRERTGDLVTIQVAPGADVRLRGRPVVLTQLRRGIAAFVVRDGDVPATWVRAGPGALVGG